MSDQERSKEQEKPPIPEPVETVLDDSTLSPRGHPNAWASSEVGKSWKKSEIQKRRVQVMKLMPYRLTQEEVGRQLGLSRHTVMHDIQAIRKQWQQEYLERYDTYRAEELAILDSDERNLRTQLYIAWHGKKRIITKPDGHIGEEWESVPDRDMALSIQDRIMAILKMKMELSGLRGGQPGLPPKEDDVPLLSERELAHRLLSAFQMGRLQRERQEHLLPASSTVIDVTPKPVGEDEAIGSLENAG